MGCEVDCSEPHLSAWSSIGSTAGGTSPSSLQVVAWTEQCFRVLAYATMQVIRVMLRLQFPDASSPLASSLLWCEVGTCSSCQDCLIVPQLYIAMLNLSIHQ